MLGGQAGGALTYNTVEQNSINFVKFTLRPWLELLEETFQTLLPRGQYVKFNVDALLRGDLMTRVQAYQVLRSIGMNNVDELRNLEEWAPLPNGEGKDYTPLLVQIAASRGIDAAQVSHHDQPSDQPTTGNGGGGGANGRAPKAGISAARALSLADFMVELPALGERLAHSAGGLKGAEQLHHYWTHGEGLAKWADTPTPWTNLYHHLLKYMNPEEAKKTASKWFEDVFGFAAGSDLNRVTHGKPPRGKVVGPG
jgi:hypothetical protein